MSADSAVKELLKTSASEIIKDEKARFETLVVGANDFLGQYENIIGDYKKYKAIFESDSTTPNDKATLLYGQMKKSAKLTRRLTKIQFQLEKVLNAFLKRKIYLTWVDQETGDFILKDEDTLLEAKIVKEVDRKNSKREVEKDFIKAVTKQRGRGNVSEGNMRSIKGDPIEDLSKDIQDQINEYGETWKNVYVEAIKRFNEVDEHLKDVKEEKPAFFYYNYYQDLTRRYYEEGNRSTELSSHGGRGRITEAYIDILMAPNKGDNEVTGLASQLKCLNDHIKVDNISAAVKGDVVLGSDSSIHFAVKTGSFSTAKFGQYYRLANNISEIGKKGYFLTKEELTNYLSSFANDAEAEQKIEELAGKRASEAVGEAISEVSK